MGAKVEAESYIPGHHAVGNLQAGANGWRSSYEEEKTSNGGFCNGFMATEAVGYSEYDKEMFKRTMLAHEAAFRQQVYELHRVYRIQRDLAKHYQNKETHACPRLEYASQRNSPSQVPLHGAEKIAAASVNNEKSHPLKFLREGSVQSSPNGFPSSDAALHTKQGMFDLELRADNYFGNDKPSDNKPIDFLGVSSDTKHQSDAGVALDRAEGLGRLGHNCPTSFLPTTSNLGGHHVAELNEPVLGMYICRTNGSVSGGPSDSLENPWQHSVWGSSATNYSCNKEFFKDKRAHEGTSSNFFDASSRIEQDGRPLINKGKHASNISFLAPRYRDTDPLNTFNVADERPANINQFIYQCPNSSTGWFSRSPLEASALNNFSKYDHVHGSSLNTLVAPVPPPHIGHPSVASRVGSCIVDPRSYNSNANVQSFPSFNGSSTVNSYSVGAANQSIRTLTHNLKKINNSDGSYSGVPLDSLSASRARHQVANSSDLEQNNRLRFEHPARHCHEDSDFANGKGRNNFNLNDALSDGQEDVLVEQGVVCVGSLKHIEGQGSVSGISWLGKKSLFADSTGLEEPKKVFEHSYETAMEMKINKDRSGAALAFCNLPDSALTSVGCEAKKNKTQESAACLPPSCQKLLPRDRQAAEVVINKSGANRATILNFFDLNDDAPNEDNSESTIGSHECHVTSLQNNHAKRGFVIDLEVPACEDAAATAAAEDILALSMDVATTDTPENMLLWFAELAVSKIDGHARQVEVQGCGGNSIDDNDLDSFESLTLKLEETKTVEFCSWPLSRAITNDEQTVSPVNLLTKPKRGQQRKRRQKRDFQKDILPSMSSLCRPEIIEDIELLEGLVQMTGGSWESSLTRRRRTRGKKPKKRLSDPVEEEVQISPPAKPDDAGLEADDRSMIGWGRTTRRCRRPRCPSGITVAAAS